MGIMQDLKAAGVREEDMDNHESDLYVKKTSISTKVINNYEFKKSVTQFRSQIDKKIWYDIPFAYDPFWEGKKKRIIPAIKNTPIIDGIIERKDMIKSRILNDDRSARQVGMDEIDDYIEDIATRYEAGQYQEVHDLWREFSKTHTPEQIIILYQRLKHNRDIELNVVDLKKKIKRKEKSR